MRIRGLDNLGVGGFGAALAAVLLAPPPALAEPFFLAGVVCESFVGSNGAAPVSASKSCGLAGFGSFSADARADFGQLGVAGSAVTFIFQGAGNAQAGAQFRDFVVFSNPDPNAPAQFAVSLNLLFEGILDAALGASPDAGAFGRAAVDINVGFLGTTSLSAVNRTGDPFSLNPGGFSGTGFIVPGPAGFSGIITTPVVQATLGSILLGLDLQSNAAAIRTGGSSLVDFLDTLGVPAGMPVFNLPGGYTANAGDWLVDNRFVDPNAPSGAVPEPSTVLLVGAGLLAFRAIRRHTVP